MAKKTQGTNAGQTSNSESENGSDSGELTLTQAFLNSLKPGDWYPRLIGNHERLQSYGILAGILTSLVGILIAATSAFIAAKRYQQSVSRYAEMEKRFYDDEKREIFDGLAASESRYHEVQIPERLDNGLLVPLDLDIYFARDNGEWRAYFRLPRSTNHILQERERLIESDDGKMALQSYTVQVPVDGGPAHVRIAPFGCVECESAKRLDSFRRAQRIEEIQMPSDHIRLARAAVDFGESSVAMKHLDLAIGLTENLKLPSIVTARAFEDVGKTFFMLSDFERGSRYLDQAKSLLRVSAREGQLGELHNLLSWEAQFAATQHDNSRVAALLSEFAATVDGYQVGESITSEMIHDAYAICLAIRSSYFEFDPLLRVPKEFKAYIPSSGGWVRPISVANAENREMLPSFLRWRTGDR